MEINLLYNKISLPDLLFNRQIGKKRKRGAPRKSTKGLELQPEEVIGEFLQIPSVVLNMAHVMENFLNWTHDISVFGYSHNFIGKSDESIGKTKTVLIKRLQ